MDQAKLDEMAAVLGNDMSLLEGAIGTLPLIHDSRPGARSFVPKYRKAYNRDPGTEASLNYTTLNAVTEAMKLAGTVSDATAIHAKLSEAFGKLSPERNPSNINSVDPKGGSNAVLVVGLVKGGKVVPVDAATGTISN
jgi:branched-chain amino acid transport system substrate-binding protein